MPREISTKARMPARWGDGPYGLIVWASGLVTTVSNFPRDKEEKKSGAALEIQGRN